MVLDVAGPFDGEIILAQTAYGQPYEDMLAATEAKHRAFCDFNRAQYRTYVEIRRGYFPWHASLNRVEIIGDMLAADWRGWLIYLDADAVILQPRFDIRRYFAKRNDAALIAADGGDHHWNVNDGVFFLNLDNPLGRELATKWVERSRAVITDEMLRATPEPWQLLPNGDHFPDEQHLLHITLMENQHLLDALLVEDRSLINYGGGRFIRQIFRGSVPDEERLRLLRELAA